MQKALVLLSLYHCAQSSFLNPCRHNSVRINSSSYTEPLLQHSTRYFELCAGTPSEYITIKLNINFTFWSVKTWGLNKWFFISTTFHSQEEMSSRGVQTVTVSWATGRRCQCSTHLSWCALWPALLWRRFPPERPTLCSSHSQAWCTAVGPINLASWGSIGWMRRVEITHFTRTH